YLSYRLHQAIGRENTFWDGLGGGPVSGSHLPLPGEVITWDAAVDGFVRANRLPGAERLVPDDFDPRAGLPKAPFIEDAALPYPDQLDFALRQDRYIATRRLRDFTLVAPLLNRHWLDFMFAVPYELRLGQRFYIEVLTTAFPRVFSLPATTTG